jgi:hypothetical protein
MKAYGGVDIYIHIFLASKLAVGEWSVSRSGRFIQGERAPGTLWIGGWVNPRAGLDDLEKRTFLTQSRLELRPPSRYTNYTFPVSPLQIYITTPSFLKVITEATADSCVSQASHVDAFVLRLLRSGYSLLTELRTICTYGDDTDSEGF